MLRISINTYFVQNAECCKKIIQSVTEMLQMTKAMQSICLFSNEYYETIMALMLCLSHGHVQIKAKAVILKKC